MSNSHFNIVIPARYESTRLPGKVLLDIVGKPMIQHVWERSLESGADAVVIATDNDRVADVAVSFGADVCTTSDTCNSGTDRVAEVCATRNWPGDTIVVNVQGDAPLIQPASISNVADLLNIHAEASIATACVTIKSLEEYLDPNVVKVVLSKHGQALYFSRASIPAGGHGAKVESDWPSSWRHLGLYAYRVEALQQLSATQPCELEITERLEQLRAMWLGMQIQVLVDENTRGPDVDTAEDLQKVKDILLAGC